jgi:ribulose-bisphosphate carboxylase large chain
MSITALEAGRDERFRVRYRVTPDDARPIEQHAKDIAIEETVEVPADCIPAHVEAAGIVGAIESIAEAGRPGVYDVVISYRRDVAGDTVPNLLNVLFGNISIRRGIKIVGMDLTPGMHEALGGPKLGIAGIRDLLGAHGRPIASTALKPVGLTAREIAALAGGYAEGGLDLIKDDHGLIDQRLAPFEERVARCQEAVTAANARTGGKAAYFPMVAGGFETIERQFAFAKANGVSGVLAPYLLIGPDTVRALAARYGLAVMAHPTFSGTHFHDPAHGMTPAVLLGTLFRLFGADISVFPNYGGRFTFTREECVDLADALRRPLGAVRDAFPAPAGGMTIEKVDPMIEAYGVDTVLLIGGALLRHSSDPAVSARAFREAIEAAMTRHAG